MNSFTFRAECLGDVLAFLAYVSIESSVRSCRIIKDRVFPDCDVILTAQCTIGLLRSIADSIDDLHVISESLEPAYVSLQFE